MKNIWRYFAARLRLRFWNWRCLFAAMQMSNHAALADWGGSKRAKFNSARARFKVCNQKASDAAVDVRLAQEELDGAR